ncbi:MAG: S1C family serine protease [Planctomycetota bacterium]
MEHKCSGGGGGGRIRIRIRRGGAHPGSSSCAKKAGPGPLGRSRAPCYPLCMRRSYCTAGLLLLAGVGCVAIGSMLGSRFRAEPEALWREGVGTASGHRQANVEVRLPSFRELVARVGDSVCSVRAVLAAQDPVASAGTPSTGTSSVGTSSAGTPERELADRPAGQSPESAAGTGTIAGMAGGDPGGSFGRLGRSRGMRNGSGFVLHERGLVLTSRHVVVGSDRIEVLLPTFGLGTADLIGQDEATDLALLRLRNPPKGLKPLSLGDSNELSAGDWIVAVGNPLGFSRTVTAGLVSFVGRHLRHNDLGVSRDFLQISAPINPGSSGGPVFDVYGNVVGVANQFASEAQGISFAVPSRAVKWALEAMRRQPDGRVRRGYLGIEFAARSDRTESGERRHGAQILDVRKGDPGELAGLRRGDIVLGVNGRPIRDAKDLHQRIVCSDPGSSIAFQLLRDDRPVQPVIAILGEIGRHAQTIQSVDTPN